MFLVSNHTCFDHGFVNCLDCYWLRIFRSALFIKITQQMISRLSFIMYHFCIVIQEVNPSILVLNKRSEIFDFGIFRQSRFYSFVYLFF